MGPRVAVDLDNTIIDYSVAYQTIAEKHGLPSHARDRDSIRTFLRKSDHAALEWRRFQADLYTEGLRYACLADGCDAFLDICIKMGMDVQIVSHKAATTPAIFGSRDMRGPALRWLNDHGVAPGRVSASKVTFCSNRTQKILHIAAISPVLVVDDLPEVLLDKGLQSVRNKWLLVHGTHARSVGEGLSGAGSFEDLTDWWSQWIPTK